MERKKNEKIEFKKKKGARPKGLILKPPDPTSCLARV